MELRKAHRSPHSRARRLAAAAAICAAALLLAPPSAFAQLDPLLFLQRSQPNVIIAVDVANRMQFDADGTYYDPYDYTEDRPRRGRALLGVVAGRDDVPPGLQVARQNCLRSSADMYTADVHPDPRATTSPLYSAFWSRTRLAVARAGAA